METEAAAATEQKYLPLSATLRLYAGWLLAWYMLIFAIAGYSLSRPLPFRSAFLEGVALSPFVLSMACGAFLFLLLSSVHHAVKGGIGLGVLFSFIGSFAWLLFWLNI